MPPEIPPHVKQTARLLHFSLGCVGTVLDGQCGAAPMKVILYDRKDGDKNIPIMACSPEHVAQHVYGTDGFDGGLALDPEVSNIRILDAKDYLDQIPQNN